MGWGRMACPLGFDTPSARRLARDASPMLINWPLLLFAIVLLWVPRQVLRQGATFLRRHRRSDKGSLSPKEQRERGDPRVDFRTEFLKFRNYVDLFRGAAGSLAFVGITDVIEPCLKLAKDASPTVGWVLIGIRFAILLIGLLLQAVRYEHRKFTFYPPIFYLTGLSVGMVGYVAALFAFILIWTLNPAFGNAQAFLFIYAVLMVVFGNYFGRNSMLSIVSAGVLCFLPALLSMLANRPLVIFSRRGNRATQS